MKKTITIMLIVSLLFTSCTSTAVYYHDVKPSDGSKAIMTYSSVDKVTYTDWTKTFLITGLLSGLTAGLVVLIASNSSSSKTTTYSSSTYSSSNSTWR